MVDPSAGVATPAPTRAPFAGFHRAAALSGLLKIVSIGLSFAFFLALSAVTTPETFGVISAAYSVAVALGYVAAVGQHVAILRFWPSLDERYGPGVASRAVGRGLLLATLGGVGTALAMVIIGRMPGVIKAFGDDELIVLCTAVLILAGSLAEFAASAMRARGILFLALAPRDVLARLVVIFALLVVLAQPVSAPAALLLVALSLFAAAVPQIAYLSADLLRHRGTMIPPAERRQFSRATLGLWASSSISPVMANITTLIVAVTLGPLAAGAYFAAERLAKLLAIALEGTETITGPLLARSFHAGRLEEVKATVAATSVLAFGAAMIGAIIYILLGRFALGLFDPSYAAAWPVLLILVLGQLVNNACGSNAILLNMAGRELDLLVIRAVWSVVTIIGIYFMSASFGLVGAAIASTGVMIGWNVTAAIVCWLRLGIATVSFGYPANAIRAALSSFVRRRKQPPQPKG